MQRHLEVALPKVQLFADSETGGSVLVAQRKSGSHKEESDSMCPHLCYAYVLFFVKKAPSLVLYPFFIVGNLV